MTSMSTATREAREEILARLNAREAEHDRARVLALRAEALLRECQRDARLTESAMHDALDELVAFDRETRQHAPLRPWERLFLDRVEVGDVAIPVGDLIGPCRHPRSDAARARDLAGVGWVVIRHGDAMARVCPVTLTEAGRSKLWER